MRPALYAASAGLLLSAVAAGPVAADSNPDWRNITTGGPLRAGIYGRIVPKRGATPPPVIHERPVIADAALLPKEVEPVYLYVPPGQVRKWKQNCAKWKACDEAVLFVRVDQSPSRWGKWRHLRDDVALQGRD